MTTLKLGIAGLGNVGVGLIERLVEQEKLRLGGVVEKADDREYGRALLKLECDDPLFRDLPGGAERVVWMSHGDRVLKLPPGFVVPGTSESSPFAAIRHAERPPD